MASNGERDSEKRKREEESESDLLERKRKRSGEDKPEEPRPGSSQDPVPAGGSFNIKDFTCLQLLGSGSFGNVFLASSPERNNFMAIKVQHKRWGNRDIIMTERRILMKTQDCPFICQLYAALQDDNWAYLIMEYLPGGSLAAMLKMCGRLNIDSVRFYTAEIICGLQFLHQRGIVHRDITLDNIMLDRSGHIRLIDLGLAQDGVTAANKISGKKGTYRFMAPEVHLGEEYDTAVDWWSLGIVVSLMVCGQSPFYYGLHERKIFKSVTKMKPQFPSWLDADLKHLLERLLRKTPERRLGVYKNISRHPFFSTIDWELLEQKRLRPPFKPFLRVLENQHAQWPEAGPPFHMDGFSFTSAAWNRLRRPQLTNNTLSPPSVCRILPSCHPQP